MKSIKEKRKKEMQKKKSFTVMMILFTIVLTYLIMNSSILDSHINQLTASYISFYNNKTDQLMIRNVKKLSTKIGKSSWNSASITFNVFGDKNQEYEIVLLPKENTIADKFIYYSLQQKKEISSSSIEKLEKTGDGGRILYKGKVNNSKMTVRLWILKKYKDVVSDNIFEIKINPR